MCSALMGQLSTANINEMYDALLFLTQKLIVTLENDGA
jgi:hypothetical protein